MSLLFSPRQNIRLLLPTIVLGDTLVKQVGFVIEQNWTQPLGSGEVSGVILVTK